MERGITGREFECAVLGNDDPLAAIPCEILPSREFYDYEDKYILDTSQDGSARRLDAGADARSAAAGCRMLQGGGLRRAWRAWTF